MYAHRLVNCVSRLCRAACSRERRTGLSLNITLSPTAVTVFNIAWSRLLSEPETSDRLQAVHTEIATASEDMRELQEELDELVLDLYDFDKEERELIKERTPTPRNPLDTRVVVKD